MVLTRASSSRLGTPLASPLPDPDRPISLVSSCSARQGTISARDRVLALRRLSTGSSQLSSPTASASTTASSPPSPITGPSLELSSQFSLLHSRLDMAQPRSPPSPLPHSMPIADMDFMSAGDDRLVTPKRSCKPPPKRSVKSQAPSQANRTPRGSASKQPSQSSHLGAASHVNIPSQTSPIPQHYNGLGITILEDPKEPGPPQGSQLEQAPSEPMQDLNMESNSSEPMPDLQSERAPSECHLEHGPSEPLQETRTKEASREPTPDSHPEQLIPNHAPESFLEQKKNTQITESETTRENLMDDGGSGPLEPSSEETSPQTFSDFSSVKETCSEVVQPDTLETQQSRVEEVQNVSIDVERVEEGQDSSYEPIPISQGEGKTEDCPIHAPTKSIENICPVSCLSENVEPNSTAEPEIISEDLKVPAHCETSRVEQAEPPPSEDTEPARPDLLELTGTEQAPSEPLEGSRQDDAQSQFRREESEAPIEGKLIPDTHAMQIEPDGKDALESASESIAIESPGQVLESKLSAQTPPKLSREELTEPGPMSVDNETSNSGVSEASPTALGHPSSYPSDHPTLLPAMDTSTPMEIGEEAQTAQSDSMTLDGQTEHTTSPQIPSESSPEEEEEDRLRSSANLQSRSRSSLCSTIVGDEIEDSGDAASDSEAELEALLRKARERCGKKPVGRSAFVEELDKIEFEEEILDKPRTTPAQPLARLALPLKLEALTPLTGPSSVLSSGKTVAPRDVPKDRFGMMPPSIKKKGEGRSKKVTWHELPRQEITPEVKREIQAMRLHGTLDPKCFVKGGIEKRLKEPIPERFQFGHIIPSGQSSSTGKEAIPKKRSFVEALVADEEAKAWAKKKYVNEVQVAGASGGKGFWKSLKKKRRKE